MIKAFDYLRDFETHQAEFMSAIERVIRSGQLILGPEVNAFEAGFAAYVGAQHAVGVASGTDALELALLVAGVSSGDEVITVANSAVPTAAAIREVGAVPRFVDIDPRTLNIDADAAARAITDRTRALLPVHLHGTPVDMAPLLEIARRRNLRIIEDCAHAHGSRLRGQHVGTAGDVGCFSFYPTKNLGAYGDGGMCVTNDPALAERLRALRMYGFGPGRIAMTDGRNSRLDELQAAVLRVKLNHFPRQLAARRRIAERYAEGLADVDAGLPPADADSQSAFHQFVIRTNDRQRVTSCLDEAGIGWGIHYETPLHHMPAYRDFHAGLAPLPHTDAAAGAILSLPIFPELRDDEVDRVIEVLRSALPGRTDP
ncbi:dTDP-3-amino-3,6-dideoxy-alpha-D-galactopyranose transaminase [Caulifigura coniformis]|uniref:dTDP-3-amino-3,6-dideoxy-alpha-D-galactopyranose transaminase n=1 Tax=Caulifigura coniformis TaxID=2527983 RepID=A0A517SKP0_9PLAN|nr:DegT/DnrJ/EryC1/StrS family aminotransferase [Caulifigura coniformis]QDT56686.1 dTDP-3-amino-3,6-dideoxy-alpha-D-galactopyranose transaminase [Caulifigura coniformis]